jgi:hypothetical protein
LPLLRRPRHLVRNAPLHAKTIGHAGGRRIDMKRKAKITTMMMTIWEGAITNLIAAAQS